ncbi:hypothetical protein ACIQ7N_09830 [Lysinibacillus sp. NPDC095746]|uniref:hypothetical protein n=1 Tax=Lysinibacillus sp. NPDC095746 TaxID=3364134 RepID=UPI0037FD7C5E
MMKKKTLMTISAGILTTSLLTGGAVTTFADNPSESLEQEEKNEVKPFFEVMDQQGYELEEKSLENYIQQLAKHEGKTYEEVATEIFEETKKIHAKYSDRPIYNNLLENSIPDTNNAIPLTNVTNTYSVTPSATDPSIQALANVDFLMKKTDVLVKNYASVTYGVDTVIYNSGSFREVVSVDAGTAFVLPSGSGTHTWLNGYQTASKASSTTVTFRATGNLEYAVSKSISAGFSAAGFSLSSTSGNTVTYRKFHQIAHTFSLY